MKTTTRKEREATAKAISMTAVYYGAYADYSPVPRTNNRELRLTISTPAGLNAVIYIAATTELPGNGYLVHWYTDSTARPDLRLTDTFAPDVNQYHHQKATDFAPDFPALCKLLNERLSSINTGAAFQ
jgi:hypothetical protein